MNFDDPSGRRRPTGTTDRRPTPPLKCFKLWIQADFFAVNISVNKHGNNVWITVPTNLFAEISKVCSQLEDRRGRVSDKDLCELFTLFTGFNKNST